VGGEEVLVVRGGVLRGQTDEVGAAGDAQLERAKRQASRVMLAMSRNRPI